MRLAVVSVVLLGVLGRSTTAAQDCQGFVPYPGRPVHFFVRGAFDNQSSLYGGGLGVGGSAAFGELEMEGTSLAGFSSSSFTVGGGGGLQLPLNRSGTAHFCPIAHVAFLLGPNNIFDPNNGDNIHYRETDYTLGGSFGFTATNAARQLKLVPTASYVRTSAHNRFTDSTGRSLSSHSRSLSILTLGVGVQIGREVSITPTVSDVSGAGRSSLTVGMRVAFALGGTRTAYVNNRATPCAGFATIDSTVYDTTQVTVRPTIRTAPELNYPPMQRDLLISGRVVLGVTVGPDGAPDNSSVQVLDRVDPALDREAIRWIEGVTYWPACRDGRPVRVRIAQPVDFCVAGCPRGRSS
jgi:TonB family protein